MFIRSQIAVLALCAIALVGCAGQTRTTPPVDDRGSTGAGTSGAPDRQGVETGPIGATAGADLLAKRRVYFAFDSSSLDDENRAIVEAHAKHLAANPNLKVHLEGNCDERGTREYNLALGERRAQAVERLMRAMNVPANRVTTVSYGEEKPIATEHNESAWRQNRRVEIVYR